MLVVWFVGKWYVRGELTLERRKIPWLELERLLWAAKIPVTTKGKFKREESCRSREGYLYEGVLAGVKALPLCSVATEGR